MTDLSIKFGLDVDKAINQLLDYKNSPTKQGKEVLRNNLFTTGLQNQVSR